jgi:hypothetical protein
MLWILGPFPRQLRSGLGFQVRAIARVGLGQAPLRSDWCFIAEQPAPAPHLAHPERRAALRIVLVTVPRVSHFCELRAFSGWIRSLFDLHLLLP